MAKIREHEVEAGRYSFKCPGCGDTHSIPTHKDDLMFAPHKWKFNGDVNKPTFSPSLLVRSGHYAPQYIGDSCWCTYNSKMKAEGKEPVDASCYICHSFIKEGRIQFLNDCTHSLAGQTVELPELENNINVS